MDARRREQRRRESLRRILQETRRRRRIYFIGFLRQAEKKLPRLLRIGTKPHPHGYPPSLEAGMVLIIIRRASPAIAACPIARVSS